METKYKCDGCPSKCRLSLMFLEGDVRPKDCSKGFFLFVDWIEEVK